MELSIDGQYVNCHVFLPSLLHASGTQKKERWNGWYCQFSAFFLWYIHDDLALQKYSTIMGLDKLNSALEHISSPTLIHFIWIYGVVNEIKLLQYALNQIAPFISVPTNLIPSEESTAAGAASSQSWAFPVCQRFALSLLRSLSKALPCDGCQPWDRSGPIRYPRRDEILRNAQSNF